MKITVFGATGNVGGRVVAEALARGHRVTAVVRDPARADGLPPEVSVAVGDARDPEAVARLAEGQDVVITATRPAPGHEGELALATKGLLAGLAGSGVRLLAVGGAGSLLLPGRTDGATVIDGPDFPADWLPIALACNEQLALYRAETGAEAEAGAEAGADAAHAAGVDWAYLSPAALLEPGERTGRFRLGRDELLVDAEGRSAISMEDLAVALLDEAERPAHHRTRFTVGY